MINTRKLRGKIIECGFTYETLAKELGITLATFSRKIRNLTDMKLTEAVQLADLLRIPPAEMHRYFFWGAYAA